MQTVVLNVDGMNCGGCVKSVTGILQAVDGVASAEVSLENKSATVSFDPAKTSAAALVEAVEEGGYEASLP